MNRIPIILLLLSLPCFAQTIAVNPKGVNVNSQGATTVFLTFGNLRDYGPAEATWCGDLISAAPDQGLRCNPASIYGLLPSRYDRSRRSGNGAYTDIMSIPPSVARRAYQAAVNGEDSRFFYVRRFVSTTGGPAFPTTTSTPAGPTHPRITRSGATSCTTSVRSNSFCAVTSRSAICTRRSPSTSTVARRASAIREAPEAVTRILAR